MKRHLTALAGASLLAIVPATPAMAIQDPPGASLDGILERCIASEEAGTFPEESLGNCIGLITTRTIGANGTIPNICGFFERSRPIIFYTYYETFEDCVHDRASFGT